MSATTKDPLAVTGLVLDGKYTVEQAIGEGGAAVVYRGKNMQVGATVAIKFLVTLGQAPESERPAIMEEFRREARLVAELSTRSSAIVQARDVGVLERPGLTPLPYLVLEWLSGKTLDEVIVGETNSGKAPRSLKETVQLLEPVAGALAIAHERNVAHRDVKPENVFVLDTNGNQPGARIKLLDFGIAKVMQARASGLQQTGTLPTAFTPHYGAPEQFSRTYGETGPWTDVFAMALVIIEVMQGGRRAFTGDDYMELARQACDEDRRPTLRTLRHPCSDAVEAVFARALAVQPMHRYPSMSEFWTALLGAVNPQAESFPLTGQSAAAAAKRQSAAPPPASTAPPRGGSRTIIMAALGIGLLVIVGAAVVAGIEHGRSQGASATASVATASATPPPVESSATSKPPAAVNLCPEGALVVAGGRFRMGSDDPIAKDDAPAHNAFVDTFCLDRTEVTAAAYARCVSAGSCATIAVAGVEPAGRCTSESSVLGEHPLNCATFDEATTYCAFRGMRLPTEAEWELAARRGGEVPWEGSDASGQGIAVGERANLDGKDGFEHTAPVASFPKGASKDGVVDLIGNVAEWTGDWFGPYSANDMVNPKGPGTGSKRSVRGGAWTGMRVADKGPAPSRLTASFREALAPDARSVSVGFRCAKSLR